jgi:hypothetical protein
VHVKFNPGNAAGGGGQERGNGIFPEAAALTRAESAMADDRWLSIEDNDDSPGVAVQSVRIDMFSAVPIAR